MYRLTYLNEEVLWWYLGMNQLTDLLLDQASEAGPLEILDAGCGTGGMLARLARRGRVTGIDISDLALDFSRRRGFTRLVRASTTVLPFKSETFDLVTSFDVLSAVPRECHAGALREFARVLRPGGRLLVRVGAYDWLRGEHDRASRIVYRYRRGGLVRALREAGFQVERITYANMVLLPVVIAKRLAEMLRGHRVNGELKTDFWLPPGPVNRALASLLFGENRLIRAGIDLPTGLSLVALARRGDAR